MKKLLLLIIIFLTGCTSDTSVKIEDLNIVTIDSCEYIRNNTYGGYPVYTHKGNCKFCIEQRKQEITKTIDELFNIQE